MNFLIIDREEAQAHLLLKRIEPIADNVEIFSSKDKAAERAKEQKFDMVFIDPSPLKSAQPSVVNLKRSSDSYMYVFLTTHEIPEKTRPLSGVNDVVLKPYDMNLIEEKIGDAKRLISLVGRIGDTSEDFPSAGGVIAKSAFNQIFLSGLERADRYSEKTFALFIRFQNYDDVKETDGPYAADFIVAKLSKHLVQIRRQSDIIGQTGQCEYALMMQRPTHDKEPLEAAGRFAQSIATSKDICDAGKVPVEIKVSLIELPTGEEVATHNIVLES